MPGKWTFMHIIESRQATRRASSSMLARVCAHYQRRGESTRVERGDGEADWSWLMGKGGRCILREENWMSAPGGVLLGAAHA